MTRYRPCEGERQDECGSWYCPQDPDDDSYDCVRCQDAYDRAVDLEVERLWEETRDDKRASWG